MMDNSENDSSPRKRKRGVQNPSNYKRNIIKKARVEGSSYQRWNGSFAASIKQGPPCNCSKKCFQRLCEEERAIIFERFRSLTTKNEQDCLLYSLISAHNVERRRRVKPIEDSSRPADRLASFKYKIQSQAGDYEVCRKGFMSIFGITNDRLRRLTTLRREGVLPIDQRGKNTSGNAKPGIFINAIIQHIASFPVKIAHYSSKEYKYLSEKLNILIMHKLFKSQHPDLNIKYSYYKKIFKEQFNLSFGRPQVDTCSTCEELDTKIKSHFLNDTAKNVAAAEKAVHLRRAKKFYAKLKSISEKCKSDEKTGGICIDYMQNLQLPLIPVQETFYLRQLTVNVMCIHNLKNDKCTFYVYHEGVGTKGPNEVVSFIKEYLESDPEFQKVENFHFFSDACAAQNRNHTIIRFFSALVSSNKFKTVEQYYPTRGHSFLPCDRDFSILKRKIKKSDRVYTIKEYAELILSSEKSFKRFTVVLPNSNQILDWKNWWSLYYKKTMLSIESMSKKIPRDQKMSFKISQFRHFIHSREHEGVVITKDFIDGFQDHSFNLRNSNREVISFPTKKAYTHCVPINIKKMQDIKKLKRYLPDKEEISAFYAEIFDWPTCDPNLDVSPDEE